MNNSAMVILPQLDKGRVMGRLSEELTKVLAAVEQTGRAGSVTLTMELKPVPDTDGKQVTVSGKVKATAPRPDLRATLFFVTEDQQLTRRNPEQREFWEPRESERDEEDEESGEEPEGSAAG